MSKNHVLGSINRELVGVKTEKELQALLDLIKLTRQNNAFGQLAGFGKTLVATATIATINPRETLFTRDGLWIDPDLEKFVGLDSCPADERPLQLVHTAESGGQSDTQIATSVGGKEVLVARKATMGQLVNEIQLVRAGEKGFFKKSSYYILYLEGKDGNLFPVRVYWRDDDQEWRVHCYHFDQDGYWRAGYLVCGN